MGHIGLSLTKPQITFRNDAIFEGWHLNFNAALSTPWHQRVDLTGPEKIVDLDGRVGFQDDSEETYEGHEVGTLSYSPGGPYTGVPDPPRFYVVLRLPSDEMRRLVDRVERGLPLRSLSIDVPAVKYGWAPDGSEKAWDNVTHPDVPIKSYRLYFGEPEDDDEDRIKEPVAPTAVSTIEVAILDELRRIGRSNQYVLCVLGILVLLALWRLT
jgi:hypothetical protein